MHIFDGGVNLSSCVTQSVAQKCIASISVIIVAYSNGKHAKNCMSRVDRQVCGLCLHLNSLPQYVVLTAVPVVPSTPLNGHVVLSMCFIYQVTEGKLTNHVDAH